VINKTDYFGHKITHPDATDERQANADALLQRVNDLLEHAAQEGAYDGQSDPDTGTQISGSRGGAGDGGFRLTTSATGAPGSAHKEGMGVDVYDPENRLDDWLSDDILALYDLYREHPSATPGWCHLQTRRPRSGRRTFHP
jgi:hypothetical protein